MTITMTLWNAISDAPFYGMSQIETPRVPMRDERVHDLFGVTANKPAGYNRWLVSRVVWSFKDLDRSQHGRQHADVYLVPEIP